MDRRGSSLEASRVGLRHLLLFISRVFVAIVVWPRRAVPPRFEKTESMQSAHLIRRFTPLPLGLLFRERRGRADCSLDSPVDTACTTAAPAPPGSSGNSYTLRAMPQSRTLEVNSVSARKRSAGWFELAFGASTARVRFHCRLQHGVVDRSSRRSPLCPSCRWRNSPTVPFRQRAAFRAF